MGNDQRGDWVPRRLDIIEPQIISTDPYQVNYIKDGRSDNQFALRALPSISDHKDINYRINIDVNFDDITHAIPERIEATNEQCRNRCTEDSDCMLHKLHIEGSLTLLLADSSFLIYS
jgi:hypothetical protein